MLRQIHGEALAPPAWRSIVEGSDPGFDRYLAEEIYARGGSQYLAAQKKRFAQTVEAHRARFGDEPCVLARAPGRLNAFLEYLDMCAGDHMSTTIDGDIPMVLSVRDDDQVVVNNTAVIFPESRFSISEELQRFSSAPWGSGETAGIEDNWDNRTRVYPHYGRQKGDHLNYVIAAFLRFAWEHRGVPLRGANLTFGPSTIPLRAGTSSSSAVVVLASLACLRSNSEVLAGVSLQQLCTFLGEGEWYVGTHGGANDQTTILCNEPNGILYNRHSRRELESTPLPFLRGLRIIVANSLWEANKALGANYVFNLRKGWMDLGNDLLERIIADLAAQTGPRKPGWVCARVADRFGWPLPATQPVHLDGLNWRQVKDRYRLFGSLDATILGISQAAVAEVIQLLPAAIDPEQAGSLLQKDRTALGRDYTLPNATDRVWRPRNAATFFNTENVIGRTIESLLLEADRAIAGGMPPEDAAYDAYRIELGRLVEALHETIRDDFMVSNNQLELILGVARDGPGYLAGKLTGAGSGGCVCIFVREAEAQAMCEHLSRAYYSVSEHFDAYRGELGTIPDETTRCEMERNLEEALRTVDAQRRIVTFSRGAGVICAPR